MMLDNALIVDAVKHALSEDLGAGDCSAALIPEGLKVKAEILSRESMLLCGQAWVQEVFHQVDPRIELVWLHAEGTWLAQPAVLCTISGPAQQILTAERTALNFLQTLSATATQTYHYVQQLTGTHTKLLDTRKTIPGWRAAQKYAVRCAGGNNHRMGLYDAFLLKENHIKAYGSIAAAIHAARQHGRNVLLEVEVESLSELTEALAAQPDRILLDNFNLEQLTEAVAMAQGRCLLEASGGISLDNIAAVAATGVDFISVGAITKSVQAIDLSLLIRNLQ